MMNIYAKDGDWVVVTKESIENGTIADKEHAKKNLRVGQIYTVHRTEVASWSSRVYLKEFPLTSFNTVNFKDA